MLITLGISDHVKQLDLSHTASGKFKWYTLFLKIIFIEVDLQCC